MRTRSSRTVMNADHTCLPILPITCVRGSSRLRARISSRSGSSHNDCAVTKLIPCFLWLDADFAGSTSQSIGYRKYTISATLPRGRPRRSRSCALPGAGRQPPGHGHRRRQRTSTRTGARRPRGHDAEPSLRRSIRSGLGLKQSRIGRRPSADGRFVLRWIECEGPFKRPRQGEQPGGAHRRLLLG